MRVTCVSQPDRVICCGSRWAVPPPGYAVGNRDKFIPKNSAGNSIERDLRFGAARPDESRPTTLHRPNPCGGDGRQRRSAITRSTAHPKTRKGEIMSYTSKQADWTKPAAMAIPEGGFFKDKVEQGRYGPTFPQTPACYGFTIIAKVIPGREEKVRAYGKTIEETIARLPDALAVLRLHYLRWVLFDIKGETYFMYQGIFDTDFDKYTEDAIALFGKTGVTTIFENLEVFPEDWKTNVTAFIKFVREHQCPSFLEYGEYPYVTSDEIKKALKLKAAFSNMLDQMQ